MIGILISLFLSSISTGLNDKDYFVRLEYQKIVYNSPFLITHFYNSPLPENRRIAERGEMGQLLNNHWDFYDRWMRRKSMYSDEELVKHFQSLVHHTYFDNNTLSYKTQHDKTKMKYTAIMAFFDKMSDNSYVALNSPYMPMDLVRVANARANYARNMGRFQGVKVLNSVGVYIAGR